LSKLEDQNVLVGLSSASGPSKPYEEVFVSVMVNGRSIQLPERVLNDAASQLQLSTEGYVGLADYVESVASVLAALERRGFLSLPS
jgi:hypothetical protein